MPLKTNIFKNYPNKYFIETGSYLGDGIQLAIDAGFKNIISIELSDKYFAICTERFKEHPFVKILQGDSCEVLVDVIKEINEPITFWLDGHYSCGDTAIGKHWTPLMVELQQIKEHTIKEHTIIIDDIRCWRSYSEKHGFQLSDILEKLKEINNKYEIEYFEGEEIDDVLIAKVY